MATGPIIPKVEGYVIAEKLGSGSYADVYKAFKKGEKRDVVAIKCVDKTKLSNSALNNLVSEIEILKKLNHDHIVRLKDFTWDSTHIYIIMEYCSGGNLLSYIHQRQRLSEKICQKFLQQLALALLYLREKNISHLDLKPQNIFLASKRLQILKIGDFGLAQYISEDDKSSLLKGSPLYMAPEIALKHEYDAKADIWSIGVILFECLFGKAPYSSKTFDELVNKIKSDKPIEIPYSASISAGCRDFLKGCLERDPSKRFDFNRFFDHPFVDLKHAPSPKSLHEASIHLSKAVEDDEAGNYDGAFKSYNEAINYLIPLMDVEKDATKRLQLRRKIEGYINRMENLKSKLKHGDSSLTIPEAPFIKMDKPRYEGNISELLNLAKTTPQMVTGLEICQSADLYVNEGSYIHALEKYEMALGMLLSILQNEPKGRRRELLVEEINRWMEQAERVKEIKDSLEGGNFHEQAISEHEKACSIQ